MLLQRLIPRPRAGQRLAAGQISSVLIVRINRRLGNTLFLTPLIRQLHELLPGAAIDLATAYPGAAALLAGLPGLRRIISFPHRGSGLVPDYLRALCALRRTRYDLVIDPDPFSTSDRIALALSRARFKLGFDLRSQWAPLTHTAPLPAARMHQAQLPCWLVAQAFGAGPEPGGIRLRLALTPQESALGAEAVRSALQARGLPAELDSVCGFFAHATGLKALPPGWWREFWRTARTLEPGMVPVEFLPAPRTPPVDPDIAALHLPSQRLLAAAIAQLRLFVSADAGPMHLASSTDVPVVALFHATDPALYGPLKPADLGLDVRESSPRSVAARVLEEWRRDGSALTARR